jgi:hypothetical protein
MSRTNRATVTVNAALRQTVINRQASMGAAGTALAAAGRGLGAGGALAPVEQRGVLAEATRATLVAHGWTVTVADGDADHYTGVEATRGDEHLLAAVGADDLITDQAGAHDCGATLDAILSGLRADGADVTVTEDVTHDGRGGSLYSVAGGPNRAHTIASTLRQTPRRNAAPGQREARRAGPERLRNSAGDR